MRTAPAILLLLLVALAGCAYPVEVAPPQPDPFAAENTARPASPQQWLEEVCGALEPVARAAPAPPIDVADLPRSQQVFLADVAARTETTRRALEGVDAAGPAPSASGEAVSQPISRVLTERAMTLTRTREALQAVPASSPEALTRTLRETAAQLPPAAPQVTVADLALPPDLQAAVPTVPPCRQLG